CNDRFSLIGSFQWATSSCHRRGPCYPVRPSARRWASYPPPGVLPTAGQLFMEIVGSYLRASGEPGEVGTRRRLGPSCRPACVVMAVVAHAGPVPPAPFDPTAWRVPVKAGALWVPLPVVAAALT